MERDEGRERKRERKTKRMGVICKEEGKVQEEA